MSPLPKNYLQAIFLQLSGIIGAGIFALPYVFYKSNFQFALIGLVAVTFITALLNHFYIEIILATKGDHQLSGYASLYLGKNFKILALLNIILLGVGILLAYIKLSAIFISIIFPFLSSSVCQLIFIFLILFFHLNGLKLSKNYLQFLPAVSLSIVLFLLFFSLVSSGFSPPSVDRNFLFFGVTIFALSGFTIIPEVEETLRGSKNLKFLLNSASLVGLLIAAFVYIVFSYAVIRISSPHLSSDAITGIAVVSPFVGKLLAFFGLINIFKASQNFLLVLKEHFYRDFSLPKNYSYYLSALIPLSTFLFATSSFAQIISITGSITIFVSALIICLIRLKISHNIFTIFFISLIVLSLALGVYFEFSPLLPR